MQFARPAIAAPVKFEINSVIFEMIERLADWATEKKVKLNSVKDDFGSLSVFADQAQTRTILENVIRNAIEAAGIDGWVRVGVEKDGAGQLVFFVEDSGPGPEIGNVANLFDPFFSGRQAGRGKGLGLSVAWRLCQMNNGNITFKLPAETNPTRFEIYLPMNEGADSNFSKQDQKTSMDSSFKAA
jgi:signal transduction histidine kinase